MLATTQARKAKFAEMGVAKVERVVKHRTAALCFRALVALVRLALTGA